MVGYCKHPSHCSQAPCKPMPVLFSFIKIMKSAVIMSSKCITQLFPILKCQYTIVQFCKVYINGWVKAGSGCEQALFRLLTTNVYGLFCRHVVVFALYPIIVLWLMM